MASRIAFVLASMLLLAVLACDNHSPTPSPSTTSHQATDTMLRTTVPQPTAALPAPSPSTTSHQATDTMLRTTVPQPTAALPAPSPSTTSHQATDTMLRTTVPQPTTALPADFTGNIPPCTPVEGLSLDPCEPAIGAVQQGSVGGAAGSERRLPDEPYTIREIIDDEIAVGNAEPPGWVTHVIVRGTFLPNTVRCTAGDPFRGPSYFVHFDPQQLSFKCYVDVRSNNYIVGAGPSTVTVFRNIWSYNEDGYTLAEVESNRQRFETEADRAFTSQELILFIGPSFDLGSEAWHLSTAYGVERHENDDSTITIMAVHPSRNAWRDLDPTGYQTHKARLEVPLSTFIQQAQAAHQARLTAYGGRIGADTNLPMLVSNINQLGTYYTAVGADAQHPGGPPVKPPPPCGLLVRDNPGLNLDCRVLLMVKDALRGTGALNWSLDEAIADWDGITTSGTPSRVTKIELADESLSGTLPASLSDLPDLTHLDLSDNSLTGSIPHAVTELDDLLVLKLSGNSLTGCIPAGLKSVTTNDLASLGLSYCPTAPAGLAQAAGAAENTVPLTWNALTGAAKYRVEYRLLSQGYWELSDVTITGTTHTLEDLECSRNYKVRVTAYGNGTAHAAEWGTPSDPITVEDGGCFAAMFSPAEYSYTVNTDARPGTRLGTITATGSRGAQDTVTYRLIDGHYGGQFALDSATGHLTVANALDDFAGETYTITVGVLDASGGWGARGTIASSCSPPPAPRSTSD